MLKCIIMGDQVLLNIDQVTVYEDVSGLYKINKNVNNPLAIWLLVAKNKNNTFPKFVEEKI